MLFVLMSVCIWFFISEKSSGQTIKPLQNKIHATEGDTVVLSCEYEGQVRSLHWYRQYPGSRPEFLLLVFESNSVVPADPPFPRLNATVKKKEKQVNLNISSASVTDSALYYCSLEPTVTERAQTLYKNIQRAPNWHTGIENRSKMQIMQTIRCPLYICARMCFQPPKQ